MLALVIAMHSGSLLRFALGFIVLIGILAIMIIGIQWLLSLAHVAIPQPLLLIAGILVFLLLLLALVDWSGLYNLTG